MAKEKEPRKEALSRSSIPDLTQYIEGYRAWFIRSGDTKLMSLGRPQVWQPHEPAPAICPYKQQNLEIDWDSYHTMEECTCGIYAMNKKIRNLYAGEDPYTIYGRVAGWGKVIVGKNGWRAQYAYPLSLSNRELAKQYGVKYERRRTRIGLFGVWFQGTFLTWQIIVPFVPILGSTFNNWPEIIAWWLGTVLIGSFYVRQWE